MCGLFLLPFLLAPTGCNRTPVEPSVVATGSSSTNQDPLAFRVTGTVRVLTEHGFEPATTGNVFGFVEDGVGDGQTTGPIAIGKDGRFNFSVPRTTMRVRIEGQRYQPCAVTIDPTKKVEADFQPKRQAIRTSSDFR